MNRDDIIRMAREAEGEEELHGMWSMHVEDLERFANLVAAAEREACAEICDKWMPWTNPAAIGEVKRVAASIRARGK